MVTLRGHSYYLALYDRHSDVIDNNIQLVLAVLSVASLGTWALGVLKSAGLTWVWPAIIAFSQALRAALPFMPWTRRKAPLASLSSDMNAVFAEAEAK